MTRCRHRDAHPHNDFLPYIGRHLGGHFYVCSAVGFSNNETSGSDSMVRSSVDFHLPYFSGFTAHL